MSGDTQQLLYVLRSMFNSDDYHKQLLRHVEFFYSQVDSFQHTLRVGTPVSAVRTYVLRLRSLSSGISHSMRTNIPAGGIVQRCNLDGSDVGKGGKTYKYRSGFCMEPQHFPDSPNKPNFPSVVLKPGEKYHSTSIYQFSVER